MNKKNEFPVYYCYEMGRVDNNIGKPRRVALEKIMEASGMRLKEICIGALIENVKHMDELLPHHADEILRWGWIKRHIDYDEVEKIINE